MRKWAQGRCETLPGAVRWGMGVRSSHFAVLALAAAGLLLGAAPADPEGVVRPDWRTKPSGDAIGRVYPDAAMRANEAGRVTMSCTVAIDGALKDCEVVSEDPVGFGFGKAALSLVPEMTMHPMTVDGRPRESGVRVPVSFTPFGYTGDIGWDRRVDCAGVILDDVDGRAIAWPPGEEQDWYGLYVTMGLRRQNLSTAQLLDGLQARLAQASKRRQPAARAPALSACHRRLKGDDQ